MGGFIVEFSFLFIDEFFKGVTFLFDDWVLKGNEVFIHNQFLLGTQSLLLILPLLHLLLHFNIWWMILIILTSKYFLHLFRYKTVFFLAYFSAVFLYFTWEAWLEMKQLADQGAH